MDLILHNARVWTGKEDSPSIATVAVKDGKTAAIGGAELLNLATSHTRIIDLNGLPLLPGMADTHLHLAETGRSMEVADLSPATSPEEMGAILRAFVRDQQPLVSQPVLGWGWNQDRFPHHQMPTLAQLDAMAPGRPLILTRVCQHIALANSRAMELAGIGQATPDPAGGEIGRDQDGRPNGIFRENAMDLLPHESVTSADLTRWLRKAACKAASLGLAAVYSDDLCAVPGLGWQEVIAAYRRLARAGELPVRVVEQCLFTTVEELQAFFDQGFYPGWQEGNFSIGPLKIVSDGSLGARTALLTTPYADAPEAGLGIAVHPWDRVDALVEAAHRRGMAAVIHAIGDGALDHALNAIQRAQTLCPDRSPRHGIVHCQITRPDQLRRIRELGVQVLVQPVFLEYDLHMADLRVGEALGRSCYAWRTMVDSGIPFSAGSDSPIESMDPFGNLYCGVTRADYEGQPAGGWHPDQRLTLPQALAAATTGAAWCTGEEAVRGRIAPGYLADYTVPSRDIFAIPPQELRQVSAALTVVGGRVVWEAPGHH